MRQKQTMAYTGERFHSRRLFPYWICLVAVCLVQQSSAHQITGLVPDGSDIIVHESVSSYSYGRDCAEVLAAGYDVSGRYIVKPDGAEEPFHVYCDMETDGGGWTVFQRREGGQVDFYLDWSDYKEGFGRVDEEHWLGNDKIRLLSAQKRSALRIELEGWDGVKQYAEYDWFLIAKERYYYKLTLGTFSGTAGDSMAYHNGSSFSTRDADHDGRNSNCGETRYSGWWFKTCHYANLNGLYYEGGYYTNPANNGIVWMHFKNSWAYSMKKTEMKMRPVLSQ